MISPGIEACIWRWAHLTPDAIAVTDRNGNLTYRELAERASALAARLTEVGVGPEARVGLATDRTARSVIAIAAILRAGGAYVPIDPAYPAERRAFLLDDAQCDVLVVTRERGSSFADFSGAIVDVDDPARDRLVELPNAAGSDSALDRLAYIIYTSGSTGKPKGVQITHRNVARLCSQTQPWYAFDENDVWTLFHSFSFDVSVFEMWGALTYGGRLVIVPHETTRDALAFRRLVRDERVTVLSQTPSAFRTFLRADALLEPVGYDALRTIIFAGELLDPRMLRPWFERHGDAGPVVVNMYGTTETTVHAMYRVIGHADTMSPRSPIGVPIPDLTIELLGPGGAAVPTGEAGEIWIGGAGVSRGYWRRPELNAERFDRAASGERRYRTGDLARIGPDGELEFLGRIDQQVKIRGFRIELGEIEAALRNAPNVADAVAIVRDDAAGEPTLAGFVVARDGVSLDIARIRAFVGTVLPGYMCPTSIDAIAEIPLTAHGKLDRAALPQASTRADVEPGRSPDLAHGSTHGVLAWMFGEILGIASVALDANFFELGGTSLQAMMLALRIAECFGTELPAGTVFRTPDVRSLARAVDTARAQLDVAASPNVTQGGANESASDEDWFDLTPAQQQMWFVQQLASETSGFNCPLAVHLSGPLDVARLRDAVGRASLRHPMLRAVFARRDGRPMQRIAATPTFELESVALDAFPQSDTDDRIKSAAEAIARRPLDLERSAGSATLLHLGGDEHLFVIVLHHVVTDGWSLTNLLEEIASDYAERDVPVPRVTFAALAQKAHREREAEHGGTRSALDILAARFAGVPATSEFPLEFARPAKPSFRSGRVAFSVSSDTTALLAALAQRERCTLNDVLLSALTAFVFRHARQRDVTFAMPYAGRDASGSDRVHGLFMNLLAIPQHVGAGASYRELVRATVSNVRAAYETASVPFSELIARLGVPREPNRHPLTSLIFAPQTAQPSPSLPHLAARSVIADPGATYNDLTLCVWPEASHIDAVFVYAAELFAHATIETLARRFVSFVERCANEPDRDIESLDLLTPDERRRVLDEWSGRARVRSDFPSFLDVFSRTVARVPDAIAIEGHGTTLTYRELDEWSNAVATDLLARGIRRESIVAILAERSAPTYVAIIGVWKAGAAYVPLDPAYPRERLAWILTDTRASLVVSATDVDFGSHEIERYEPTHRGVPSAPALASASDLAALAYVIYTSGSSGTPKGVAIEQRGLATVTAAIVDAFPLDAGARVLQYVPLSFDVSIAEITGTFAQGATLVLPESAPVLAGRELLAVLERERIAQALLPMSVIAQLEPRDLPNLVRLVSGGERCPAAVADRWSSRSAFYNAYGPTEASVGASIHRCVPGEGDPPIGRPILGTSLYVLDENGRLVPPLVAGELYIGGSGLARGYLGRESLSAERFLAGTPDVAERVYRTGDRVRWRRDGALDFVGRTDDQVKVRGFRIELGEIEAALHAEAGVREAAAAVVGEGATARVVAYVVPRVSDSGLPSHLLDALRVRLPAHLIPSDLVMLEALPLTPNGKVDRAALPTLALREAPVSAERSGVIADAWRAVLGRDVPRTTNFFDAGGTSLLLVELHEKLVAHGMRVTLAELFDRPTQEAMSEFVRTTRTHVPAKGDERFAEPIAIVGMAARFPGAPDIDAFWRNLRDGLDTISRFSLDQLVAAGIPHAVAADPAYVPARGTIAADDAFDATFFEMSAREAERLDPQHRVWLECALTALEDAACDPRRSDAAIGMYAGVGTSDYLLRWVAADPASLGSDYQLQLGNEKDFAATRASYKLGLRGPSLSVQTACSTSLVAVATACAHLLSGECDVAVAGAVSIGVPSTAGYLYREGMILASDGTCRPFDASASGTVTSDGVGAVVLKRLSDALADGDAIRAVIAGAAINNDGEAKVGYTAPSGAGQRAVIERALARAGITAREVSYIEAHGTGTHLGDPIEFGALREVFEAHGAARGSCVLGSVKGNIGHVNTAAGIAGLIKTVLALEHHEIPGTAHYAMPNPHLALESSPFVIDASPRAWNSPGPRIAGVSSFGIGGTNAHLVVAEAPATVLVRANDAHGVEPRPELLPLSAASRTALAATARALATHLETREESLASIARTLQLGRGERAMRDVAIASDRTSAIAELHALAARAERASAQPERRGEPRVALLFPGQGAQSARMGLALLRDDPHARAEFERVDHALRRVSGRSILTVLERGEVLDDTSVAQPALFAVEYALATALARYGIRSAALLGHSLGEYVAATLAGVFSLDDALRIVTERGRLMAETSPGAMLSLPLDEARADLLLGDDLDVAAINAPSQCVVAGSDDAIARCERALLERGLEGRRLKTSRAFHSRSMDPILGAFRAVVARASLHEPSIPFVSCTSGTWITPAEAVDPDYWVGQLRRPVRFHDALATLLTVANVVVEVGPGETLATLARRHPDRASDLEVRTTLGRASRDDERRNWLSTIGALWTAGMSIDWDAMRVGERPRLVHLPTYPFERTRYWGIPASTQSDRSNADNASPVDAIVPDDDARTWLHVPVWRTRNVPAMREAPRRRIAFVDRGTLGTALASALGADVIVRSGASFARLGEAEFVVRAGDRDDLARVFADAGIGSSDEVVHAWSLDVALAFETIDAALNDAYFSMLAVARVLAEGASAPRFVVLTAGAQRASTTRPDPLAAAVAAAARTVAVEFPNLACRCIDLPDTALDAASAAALNAELLAADDGAVVCIRDGVRLALDYERAPQISPPDASLPKLRVGGAYVVTGGLGGIGLALAEHLATVYRARLLLVSRTSLLSETDLEARARHDDEARRRLRALENVRANAAQVVIVSGDVGVLDDARAIVARATEAFGRIDGVVHAAGVAGGGAVARRDDETAREIMHPKIAGTLALDLALANVPHDFLFLCSSLTALHGVFGQAEYSAANAFLDAFAAHHDRSERRVISVNWDGWDRVGAYARFHADSSEVRASADASHPLLDDWTPHVDGGTYATHLDAARWIVAEHRVNGIPTVPGTAYLEIACEAARAHGLAFPFEVRELTMIAPCLVPDDDRIDLFTEVRVRDGELELSIGTLVDGVERVHALARVGPSFASPRTLSSETLRKLRALDDGGIRVEREGIAFGPRWASLRARDGAGADAIGSARIPDAFRTEVADYVLHPALFDTLSAVANVRLEHESNDDVGGWLPFSYAGVTVFAPLKERVYAAASTRGDATVRRVSVEVSDIDGNVLVAVAEYTLRAVAFEGMTR